MLLPGQEILCQVTSGAMEHISEIGGHVKFSQKKPLKLDKGGNLDLVDWLAKNRKPK